MLRTSANKRERGQAIFESALPLITVIVLIIGVIDCAQFLYVQHALQERVRAAVRWGAVREFDEEAVRSMVLYQQPAPGAEKPGLGLKPANVEVRRIGQGTSSDRLTVAIVNFRYTLVTPGIAGVFTAPRPVSETLPME